MFVLSLDSKYTVKLKYSPLPSGVPSGKGLYLTVHPLSRSYTDTVYHEYTCLISYFASSGSLELSFPLSIPGVKLTTLVVQITTVGRHFSVIIVGKTRVGSKNYPILNRCALCHWWPQNNFTLLFMLMLGLL